MTRADAVRLDRDLFELPERMRWREWMMRAEAAIFASPKPVTRETLAGLVGDACRLDALIADINEELKARPYEIVFVAGGFQFARDRAMQRRFARSWGRETPGRRLSPNSKCWRSPRLPISSPLLARGSRALWAMTSAVTFSAD